MPGEYDELVKVKNVSKEPFYRKWSPRESVEIGPNEVKILPFDVMVYLLGDPRATGNERKIEFGRLCANYGIYEDAHRWPDTKPPLKVKSLDDEDIVTVADDPEGDSVEEATSTVAEKAVLEQHIQVLQRQMKEMQAQLETQIRADNAGGEVSEDEPSKVAVGPRRGRER